MTKDEINRVQNYLRRTFGNDTISVKGGVKEDLVEVMVDGEFIATISRDDEEGEVSYALSMAILDFDLED